MHRRHASSVLSMLLVVVNTVALSLPFPHSHPHGQVGPAPASEVPGNVPRVQARTLKPKLPANHVPRHDASEKSSFALNSPKTILARHIRAKTYFRRVARRNDLTDGYGSLPAATDLSAVVGWALNGYGKGDKKLVNGYGAIPESLNPLQAGSGADDAAASDARRDGALNGDSTPSTATHSIEPRGDAMGNFLPSKENDSSVRLVSDSPPDGSFAKFKSHTHGPPAPHFATPKTPESAADNVCEVQVSYMARLFQPLSGTLFHSVSTLLRPNAHWGRRCWPPSARWPPWSPNEWDGWTAMSPTCSRYSWIHMPRDAGLLQWLESIVRGYHPCLIYSE